MDYVYEQITYKGTHESGSLITHCQPTVDTPDDWITNKAIRNYKKRLGNLSRTEDAFHWFTRRLSHVIKTSQSWYHNSNKINLKILLLC